MHLNVIPGKAIPGNSILSNEKSFHLPNAPFWKIHIVHENANYKVKGKKIKRLKIKCKGKYK